MSTYSYFLEGNTDGGLCAPVLPDVDVESIVDDNEIEKAYEDSALEAAMRICAENTQNWNAIMEACTITEYICLEQTGEEFVYEGAKLDSFFEGAKAFFHKVWVKIQEIFKKVVAQFDGWFKSDKEFVKKYKDLLTSSQNRGFGDKEMEVYDYKMVGNTDGWVKGITVTYGDELTISNVANKVAGKSIDFSGSIDAAREVLKEITSENETEYLDTVRADILKSVGVTDSAVTAGEFSKKAKEALEGEKDSKKLGTLVDPAIKFLSNSADIKKALNDGLKANKTAIDKSIKSLEDQKKELAKAVQGDASDANAMAGLKHTLATKAIGIDKSIKNILVQYNGICLDSLKKASRQCKAVCVKALTYSGKKGEDRPSVLQQESAMSLLDNLRLV